MSAIAGTFLLAGQSLSASRHTFETRPEGGQFQIRESLPRRFSESKDRAWEQEAGVRRQASGTQEPHLARSSCLLLTASCLPSSDHGDRDVVVGKAPSPEGPEAAEYGVGLGLGVVGRELAKAGFDAGVSELFSGRAAALRETVRMEEEHAARLD